MGRMTNEQSDGFASGRASGPDFLCIGQQKAGTQWLYDMLQFQPEFWVTPVTGNNFMIGPFVITSQRTSGA